MRFCRFSLAITGRLAEYSQYTPTLEMFEGSFRTSLPDPSTDRSKVESLKFIVINSGQSHLDYVHSVDGHRFSTAFSIPAHHPDSSSHCYRSVSVRHQPRMPSGTGRPGPFVICRLGHVHIARLTTYRLTIILDLPPRNWHHACPPSLGSWWLSFRTQVQLSDNRSAGRRHKVPHYRSEHDRNRPCKGGVRVYYCYPNPRQGEGFHSVPFLTSTYQCHCQNKMINDGALVELAKYCARTCHVLKDVTQGRDTGSLSSPRKKAIEDLGKYVNLAHSSYLR